MAVSEWGKRQVLYVETSEYVVNAFISFCNSHAYQILSFDLHLLLNNLTENCN